MALAHNFVALNSSTAVNITPSDPTLTSADGLEKYPTWNNMTLYIENVDSSATVYIGSSTVTSSSYGMSLLPGNSLSIDGLAPTEGVYAISTGSSNVAVLVVLK